MPGDGEGRRLHHFGGQADSARAPAENGAAVVEAFLDQAGVAFPYRGGWKSLLATNLHERPLRLCSAISVSDKGAEAGVVADAVEVCVSAGRFTVLLVYRDGLLQPHARLVRFAKDGIGTRFIVVGGGVLGVELNAPRGGSDGEGEPVLAEGNLRSGYAS